MNRQALAAMLAMAISGGGCARARTALPANATKGGDLGPVELTPLESIKTSINERKVPSDLSTVRASKVAREPAAPLDAPPLAPAPTDAAIATASVIETASTPLPSTPPAEEELPALPAVVAPSPELPSPEPETPVMVAQAPASPSTAPATPSPAKIPMARPSDPEAAGADAMPLRTDPGLDPGKRAARTAVIVGSTLITERELLRAICLRANCKKSDIKEIPPDQFREIAKVTLDSLIDRTLLLQEARRDMKKEQQWTMFSDYAEKQWKDKEIPPMLRKASVEDEFALRKKMEAEGESLDDMRDSYKAETMSREFLMIRIQPKVERPTLPEMKAYYAEHKNDPTFHREAAVKWHEILVPVEKPSDLAAARKKAAAVRARLLAGEDFEKLAKETSGGITAAKGGAWDTSPDGYPVPAVNAALATLGIAQISPPIESPKGIHVIRVDSRHDAGPTPFVELQQQIARSIFEKRFTAQVETFMQKLRAKTTISSPYYTNPDKAKADAQTQPAGFR